MYKRAEFGHLRSAPKDSNNDHADMSPEEIALDPYSQPPVWCDLKVGAFYIQRPDDKNGEQPFIIARVRKIIREQVGQLTETKARVDFWELSTLGEDRDWVLDPYHLNGAHVGVKEKDIDMLPLHILTDFVDEVKMVPWVHKLTYTKKLWLADPTKSQRTHITRVRINAYHQKKVRTLILRFRCGVDFAADGSD